MRFVKPLDENILHLVVKKFKKVITVEEGCISGGFGSAINEFIVNNNYTGVAIRNIGIPDFFVPHGTMDELHKIVKLDESSLHEVIKKTLK